MQESKDFLTVIPSDFEEKEEKIIFLPPSKSDTLRACLFAGLAKGTSKIFNPLVSPDTDAMLKALVSLGAKIVKKEKYLEIQGTAGSLREGDLVVDAGNSGIVLRFIGALSSLRASKTTFTGDHSICTSRVVAPLLEGIKQLKGKAFSLMQEGKAPFLIQGKIEPGYVKIKGEDSQPVSALLIATSFLKGKTLLEIENKGELPWIQLTLDWLQKLGAPIRHFSFSRYEIEGFLEYPSFDYEVMGDTSAFFYPVVIALLSKKKIRIQNMVEKEIGDFALLYWLKEKGLKYTFHPEKKECVIEKGSFFQGGELDVNPFIDQLPLLAVLACFGTEKTLLKNGKIARSKESDRIEKIAYSLKKMGAHLEELEDGLIIYPSSLEGALLETYFDHRLAMSLIIAALFAKGDSQILGISCINKSFPNFIESLKKIGARFS